MTRSFFLILIVAAFIASACGPNQRIINSAQENREAASSTQPSNIAPAANSFERELNAMRNADFKFIYAFRRKDGAVLDSDDKAFINATSPQEMNRRTLADEGRALLIGSNFRMPPVSLETFKTRFLFEDHSSPEFRDAENSNHNSAR